MTASTLSRLILLAGLTKIQLFILPSGQTFFFSPTSACCEREGRISAILSFSVAIDVEL